MQVTDVGSDPGMREGEGELGKEEKPVGGCVIQVAPGGNGGSAPLAAPEKLPEGRPELSARRKELLRLPTGPVPHWGWLPQGNELLPNWAEAPGQELERLLSGWLTPPNAAAAEN